MSSSQSGPQIKRKSVPLIGQSAESFRIGPLSPSLSDPLTNGTPIPAPEPPTPPPQEVPMLPSTPPQTQAPLSEATYNNYLNSATSLKMPGTFPSEDFSLQDEPQSQTSSKLEKMGYQASASASPSPYTPSTHPSASSRSPRRPSSVFRLLPFKRSYNDRASSSADSFVSGRPQTPGADSMMGSLAGDVADKTVKKKKSGTFWGRRKSSLNFVTGVEETGVRNGNKIGSMRQRTVSSNDGAGGGDAVYDGEEEFPPRLKKKKSLTFWRRTSSLGLDRINSGDGQQQQPGRNGRVASPASNGYQESADTVTSEPDPITLRPRSPPPRLPEVGHVVQEEGGLMGDEDWFGSIR
ncbi:MAG: hypothetical protein L6R35_001144 [Caloplaca aegaea]|nr:MAG: hypothetical protein L6R35_001144 [Caloplaca aegaea]